MSYRQVRSPRTWVQDWAGACLRFAQSVFNISPAYHSAWAAWLGQTGKHTRNMPTNVAVAVWFSHWGTYGNPAYWDNWGHIVVWIPGRGYLSSPGANYGQAWFPTIAAVERYFGAKYVGWTSHLHGVQLVRWVATAATPKPKPTPAPTPEPVTIPEEEDDMYKPTVHIRRETHSDYEAMRVHPGIGRDLKEGQTRRRGNVTVFPGFEVTTNKNVGIAWARMHARGSGHETSITNRAGYIEIQKQATAIALELR